MPAAVILQLVEMVISFLLQLFGRNPAKIVAYVKGEDVWTPFRSFVVASRQRRLKTFVTMYAITKGVNPDEAYAAVLAQLQVINLADVQKQIDNTPAA